jgi:tetratricopeptide (TPR) repeat protein
MSKDKNKTPNGKVPPAKTTVAKPVPIKVPPLFRKIDWLVLAVVFVVIWAVYLFTLAPELTLEDCGELCTASYYAGIPHPPGYPFWAIYSWLWTLLPFGNVTWRVEVGETFAAAMACGLVGFMVSRGSSMLIEGIEELKNMDRKWETAICIVTGLVAGLMLGFDGFMWKESVVINRISVFDVPWLMIVALCLLRWIYAPRQLRYLYIGMFVFGLCATIHQTMLVAAMGIEVCIAVAHPRYGRTFFLGNSTIFLAVLILMKDQTIPALNAISPMFVYIFYFVGIASIAAYSWLVYQTKETFIQVIRDACGIAVLPLLMLVPSQGSICIVLALFCVGGFIWFAWGARRLDLGWLVVLICGVLWAVGASFYFYEPLAGMTDPPMQWGYPRTVEGFFHALSRGQYEKASPTDVVGDPGRFATQLHWLFSGLAQSYTWVCLLIALLPFLFIFKMKIRERAWIIGLTAIYFCVGILLLVIMNTSPDRQSADECKVFFTASHAIVAIMIGYGLALMAAYMATHYQQFRRWGLLVGGVAVVLGLYCLVDAAGKLYFGPGGGFDSEHVFLLGILIICLLGVLVAAYIKLWRWIKTFNDQILENFFLWGLPVVVILSAIVFRLRSPEIADVIETASRNFIVSFFHSPVEIIHSKLPHYILQAFAKNQYGSPVFANLIVFLLPIIFITALLVYRQRGPVLILLCLCATMPVYSGLTHWYKSEQRNHWFGYWFGHDMFTPPFGIYPEIPYNTILFGGTDPGRFCPTYMIFCESFIKHKNQPEFDQKFDRRDVYLITQNALADGTYLDYLRAQYFRSQQHDPPFFSRFFKYVCATIMGDSANVVMDGPDMGKGSTGNRLLDGIADLLDTTLDKPFTALGAKIEARRRAEGVYPKKEIYIPSGQDSQDSFQEYTEDVQRRQQLDQLKPGEIVKVQNGRVQVSGQVAVMMINGLLCKVIFDRNPTNAFYVEESFPLDWMYPYETPAGIIMKINRQPVMTLTPEVLQKDHEFWSKYSERLIGNWITYDTTPQEIADFAQKVYIGNNYAGYKGDRKFIRDDGAQKAFSKLRSSIAGMYAWRLSPSCPPEYRPKTDAEMKALIRETDFAFKQSFAFCPYSPEAVYRYVNFLLQYNRLDDALIVARTCLKLDPFNDSISSLINQLESYKKGSAARDELQKMQTEAATHPTNFQNILALGSLFAQMQQTNQAAELFSHALSLFDQQLADSNVPTANVLAMAQIAAAVGNMPKLGATLEKLVVLEPENPEAFYDLAAYQAITGNTNEAIKNLGRCLDFNARRLATNAAARNMLNEARNDPHFNALRNLPAFQKLVPEN